ncbi:MAG: flagellar filament capping protein FliD [Candidatus Marinimicrobia bacterium]|nr:flagellar filament capping protein FliD [Candidatus Neomarinimicrobiota bacterium]
MDITSIFDSKYNIDYLVEIYMAQESKPKKELEEQKEALNQKKEVLNNLDSKMSALKSIVDRLTDPITNYFAQKSATSSDTEKFTVSAGASATAGTHSISVERLASSDTRVSKQFTDTDTSFTGFTTDQTFYIEVAHPTDSDPNNRVSIEITVSASTFSQNDDDVLADIAEAINSAMSNAVLNETIDNDEVVHAYVVSEESGKSRLVLRSENSGYTYRMDFTDSSDNLLNFLEVNSGSQSSGSSGGWITYVGTSPTDSELNSKFNIDGLTFYRDSNHVTDVLSGLTIDLLDTFSTEETITVTSDTEAVKEEVQDFIDAYNDLLDFLKENTQINPDTYNRGLLTDELTYKNIIYDLRNYIMSEVTGVTNTDYNYLFKIGIEPDEDGKLSIADSEEFEEALEANYTNVSDLFRATDGIATRIKDYIERFVTVGGTIDKSINNLESQISSVEDRIDAWDEILAKREQQLRDEFAKLQEMMTSLTYQLNYFSNFFKIS